MKAAAGDRIVHRGRTVGNPNRTGQIVEVRGEDGQPPYFVRWDDGHEGLVFPGPDTIFEHESPTPGQD
jgi:hypothetical protein